MPSLLDHGKQRRKKITLKREQLVVGIDLSSTKFAAVSTSGGVYISHKKTKFKNLVELKTHLSEFLDELSSGNYAAQRAYIEEAVVARGGSRVTIQQAYAMGAVRLVLEERNWSVSLVNVGTWKKQVVGNGRADKTAISEWLRTNDPELFSTFSGDQDLIDAACVGRFGTSSLRTARILDEERAMPRADSPILLTTGRRRATKG
ncbi:ruvC Crossover junction endodeoxyribonuclease RuvC [uncultured Caudovirales phage]|uniref:RuvC Crossover junction endodeoxyribonuclease RuvC n=1 Tax=uncultured Caudovirales phage TaxID=2100421 RepID=A0A6J5R8S3_9CAUD|nr:ruvC Crossover junction endodeoxyribonuclease RuvC [uncultured Caudovirales phage]